MANPSDNIDDDRSGQNGGGNGASSGGARAPWSARDLDNEGEDLTEGVTGGDEELLDDQPRFSLADLGASIDEAVSTRPVLALAMAFVAGAVFARLAL